jgi:branched-chain amino acid transport system substrate-binding protein
MVESGKSQDRMRINRRQMLSWSGAGALSLLGSGLLAACSAESPSGSSTGSPAGGSTPAGTSGGGSSAGSSSAAASSAGGSQTGQSSGSGGASGTPIKVGASLSLTGSLASSALIHKTAGDVFVDRLNKNGGLLGRPVQWIVIDDQSQNDKAAAAYERLITEEKVDLISAPYGTGTTSAAMTVAQRYGYLFPNTTGSLTYQYSYAGQFPSWSSGRYPNESIVSDLLDMLEESGGPLKKIAFVVNEFPGSNYVALGTDQGDDKDRKGAIDVATDRGYEVMKVTYPIAITDWAPIAAQVRSFAPELIFNAGVGLDGSNLAQALQAVNFAPKGQFSLWSSPAPLDGLGATSNDIMLAGLFLPTMPQAQTDTAKEIVAAYAEKAKADKTYPIFETQAASEWVAWEFLVQAVEGTKSLEHDKLIDWLATNGITSELIGKLTFDKGANNYTGNTSIIEQLQDGVWQSVWPADKRSAKVVYPKK